ncbi:MAG: hypothetical protein LBD03_07590 [Methanobrevibacter sp.]|nr:hypothetical protein [Candidatus Methanovirga procula]
MRSFQKESQGRTDKYYEKLESQQRFYILLLSGIVAALGLLMTLLKFWS